MENYKRKKLLGSDSFSVIYRYKMKQTGSHCTIKVSGQQCAVREAETLKSLQHSNVVKYLESFEENNMTCLVMEDLKECLLDRLHAQNKALLPERQIWDWLIQICEGVNYIHGKDIIHGDIKTTKIFIGATGVLKIVGFEYSEVADVSENKGLFGTVAFMAPEVIAGQAYTYKRDIWSLGCVLYYMATLSLPFTGENTLQISLHVANGSYPRLSNTQSLQLRSIIKSLLSLDPEERPTAIEVLDTIREGNYSQRRGERVLSQLPPGVSTEAHIVMNAKDIEVMKWQIQDLSTSQSQHHRQHQDEIDQLKKENQMLREDRADDKKTLFTVSGELQRIQRTQTNDKKELLDEIGKLSADVEDKLKKQKDSTFDLVNVAMDMSKPEGVLRDQPCDG